MPRNSLNFPSFMWMLVLASGCSAPRDPDPSLFEFGDPGPIDIDDYNDSSAGSGGGGQKDPEAPPPPPFEETFAELVPNTVQWAGVLVSVTGVRVIGGRDDELAGFSLGWANDGPVRLDPYMTYVEVDLELTNVGAEEVDYRDRSTWDLVLADGSHLTSVDMLGVIVLPGDTATARLHYRAPDDLELAGAALQLEAGEYATASPARIPFDATLVREFPRRIDKLVGTTLQGPEASFTFDEAMWDDNVERSGRAALGKRCVWMHVAVTAVEDVWIQLGAARISADGRGGDPLVSDSPHINGGTTEVSLLAFEVDEDTTELELLFAVMADGSGTKYAPPIRLALAETTLADLPQP